MQKKTCLKCQNPIFSKKLCLYHYKNEYPEKFQIKRSPLKPKATGGFTKKVGIKKISKTQKNRLSKYYELRDIYLKEHPICEFPECKSTDVELHHKKGRSGENLYKHFMSVCREHHLYIHEHSAESYQNEWLLKKHT